MAVGSPVGGPQLGLHGVVGWQADRLSEKAGPKTINDEVQLLIRLCGEQGVLIRATLRRDKALKLVLPPSPGRPWNRSLRKCSPRR